MIFTESDTVHPIHLHVSADITTGTFPSVPSSCVIQYSFISLLESNWEVTAGEPSGTTQRSFGDGSFLVWNCPTDCTFRGSHFRGWPRFLITLIARDWLDRDYVYGYASCYIPVQSGRYEKAIPVMRPRASSWFRDLMGYIKALRPSLVDPHKSFTTRVGQSPIPMNFTGATVNLTFQVICETPNSDYLFCRELLHQTLVYSTCQSLKPPKLFSYPIIATLSR